MRAKYFIQQGTDYAPMYWNGNFESSKNLGDIMDTPFTREKAWFIRDLWNNYGKHKSVFKVIEIETES